MYKTLHKKQGSVTVQLRFARSSVTFCAKRDISYVEPGDTHGVVAHTVKSGTMILAPRGYHPTVAAPGTRNTYLWVLAAHSHKSRRYDLAVLDPKRAEMN